MLVEVSKINKQEVTVVSSLDVAETFEKRHADVLRDIENLGCSTEFRERNFAFSEYKVEGNNKKISYVLYYPRRLHPFGNGLHRRKGYEVQGSLHKTV